jgi:hypothetical protein
VIRTLCRGTDAVTIGLKEHRTRNRIFRNAHELLYKATTILGPREGSASSR